MDRFLIVMGAFLVCEFLFVWALCRSAANGDRLIED